MGTHNNSFHCDIFLYVYNVIDHTSPPFLHLTLFTSYSCWSPCPSRLVPLPFSCIFWCARDPMVFFKSWWEEFTDEPEVQPQLITHFHTCPGVESTQARGCVIIYRSVGSLPTIPLKKISPWQVYLSVSPRKRLSRPHPLSFNCLSI